MKHILFSIVLLAFIFSFAYPVNFSIAQTFGFLLADEEGRSLYGENETKKLIPASTTKLLTSLVALETLGQSYHFKTWFAYDNKTRNLHIKGFGNPLFISEEIQALCYDIIRKVDPATIHDIILDHSYFRPDIKIPGTQNSLNPYDSTTGALCANFNTVFFKWDNARKQYISAEPQTPMLDIFRGQIKASGQKRGRILLSKENRQFYAGYLINSFFKKQKIPVTGSVVLGALNVQASNRGVFESEAALEQIVRKLLKFSNNFMANQLMLVLGANEFGPPATLEKGVTILKQFAETQLGIKKIDLIEGSGISRQNRLAPEQMLKILIAFMPYHDLMQKKGNEYYKTGTLSDVRTRAGYFRGEDNRLYPFVIMLNETRVGYENIRRELKQKVFNYSKRN